MTSESETPIYIEYFEAALRLLTNAPNGFTLADIDSVECACWLREPRGAYGYVVALHNHRRLYLGVSGTSPQALRQDAIRIVDLLPHMALPNLEPPLDPYWYLPLVLNAHLEKRRRPGHGGMTCRIMPADVQSGR